jgi:hypothetical protein
MEYHGSITRLGNFWIMIIMNMVTIGVFILNESFKFWGLIVAILLLSGFFLTIIYKSLFEVLLLKDSIVIKHRINTDFRKEYSVKDIVSIDVTHLSQSGQCIIIQTKKQTDRWCIDSLSLRDISDLREKTHKITT